MSHEKQCQVDTENLIIRMRGSLKGNDYGVVIDIKNGQVQWDAEIPWKHPPTLEDEPRDKSSDCPGCRKGMWKLIRGGMGWAKEMLQVGQVSVTTAGLRKALCEECPSNCYDFGVCRDDFPDRPREEQLALKVTQASESCPHKHWGRTDG
jgi:hypothetical protein